MRKINKIIPTVPSLPTKKEWLLWFTLVDFATVYSEIDVRFTFKNGSEITS